MLHTPLKKRTFEERGIFYWSWVRALIADKASIPGVKSDILFPLFEPFRVNQIPEKEELDVNAIYNYPKFLFYSTGYGMQRTHFDSVIKY